MGRPDGAGAEKPLTEAEIAVIIKSRRSASPTPKREEGSLSVLPEILACVSANSFHVPLGLTLGYSAVLLPQLEKDDSDIKVNPTTESTWIASVVALAVVFGSLFTGMVMNFLGRVTTVRVAIIPYCIGWGVIATASGVPALIFGRFLSGLAAGTIGTNPGIVYTTEVAQPKWRGSLISTAPFMVSLGTMFVYILGAFLRWRTVAWICFGAPIIPLISTLLWSPESPLWLAEKGKKLALERALKFLARKHQSFDPVRKANEMLEEVETRRTIQKNRHQSRNLCENFFKIAGQKTVFRPLLLLISIFFVQQFSGIYVVQFYAVSLFEITGSAMDPRYAAVVMGSLRVCLSVVTIILLRWCSRRPLMVISALGMMLSMGLAGYYASVSDSGKIPLSTMQGSFATASILIFMTFAMIGMLTIPWTMTAELFPSEARSYGQGAAIAFSCFFMFGSVQTFRLFQIYFSNVARVLWMYSGMAAVSIVIVVLFLPETHGRPLPAIEEYFRSSWLYPGYERRLRRYAEGPTVENGHNYEAVSS